MTEPPVRPYDLRLVPSALMAWGATALGVLHGSVVVLALAVVLGALATVSLVLGHRTGRVAAGLTAVLVLGGCFAAAAAVHVAAFERNPAGTAATREAWVSAAMVVQDDPRRLRSPGPETVMVRGQLTQMDIAGVPHVLTGRVLVFAPADGWADVLPGQRVVFRGRLSPPDRADLTVAVVRVHGPPSASEGPSMAAAVAGHVRSSLKSAAARSLPPDRAGLLPGMVVGDVSALPEDVEAEFKAAGLTHLTAVSGANFSIVLGAVLLLARGVGLGPRVTAAMCAVVLVLFVVIARPSPSVLRAAVMGGIGLLALVTGRRRQAVPALCAAVLGLLAWWPELAVDFGFHLSVSATAGLVLLAPVWVDWLRGHGWGRASAEVVAVAAAAHAVTAPIVAAMSGTFSVVGVAANVAVAPMVAPITVIGAVAAVIAPLSTGVASVVAFAASGPLWWLTTVAEWAASAPGAGIASPSGWTGTVVVLGALVAATVMLRFGFVRWVAGAACVAALVFWIGTALV